MQVQTVVVVDGQLSSFTFVSIEGEILVYERNGSARRMMRSAKRLTQIQLLERLRDCNPLSGYCSTTHMAFYWLLIHGHFPLPNVLTVQKILKCFQRDRKPKLPTWQELLVVDPIVSVDPDTICRRLEHWTIAQSEYWLAVFGRACDQALAWKQGSHRLFKLWLEPSDKVESMQEMRNWLAGEQGPVALEASEEEVRFYWLQSYGRQHRAHCKPTRFSTVSYPCFSYQVPMALQCAHYQCDPELLDTLQE
jgi:hypothetical protein